MTEITPRVHQARTGPMIPMVHLNGSGYTNLRDQLLDVVEKLDAAIAAMQRATPHGRDYYPMGPEAINLALDDATKRMKMVETVREEFAQIFEGLAHPPE